MSLGGLASVGESEAERTAREMADLYADQIAEGSDDSFWSSISQGGKNFVKQALNVIDLPRALVTSTAQELGDLIGPGDASPSEWLDQLQPGQRVSVRDWIPDDSWAAQGVQGFAIGLVGDTVVDPLTALGPASWATKTGSKSLARSQILLGDSKITQASLSLAADEGDGVALSFLKQLDEIDALKLDEAVGAQAERAEIANRAAEYMVGKPQVERVERTIKELLKPGGSASRITDEGSLKAVFANHGRRKIKNPDKAIGYRFRNPITGTGYGPQLLSQDQWAKLTYIFHEGRGAAARSKYYRFAADRWGDTFRTVLRRSAIALADDPNVPAEASIKAIQAEQQFMVLDQTHNARIKDLRSNLDLIGDWMGDNTPRQEAFFRVVSTLDQDLVQDSRDILEGFASQGRSKSAREMNLDDAVGLYRSTLATMRDMENAVRPDSRIVGYIGPNYVPTVWTEQVADVVSRHRSSRKIGKDSPRQIFPEWMGEEVPSVQKALAGGKIHTDEDGVIRLSLGPDGKPLGFEYGTYYDEVDNILRQRLGDDFVSAIVRDPIKVAVAHLESRRRNLRHWTAIRTMADNGLGYWADTLGGALGVQEAKEHLVRLHAEITEMGEATVKFAEESAELDGLMRQVANAVHTGQILEWMNTKKLSGVPSEDMDWDDLANAEMILNRGVLNLVEDLHSWSHRARQQAAALRTDAKSMAKVYKSKRRQTTVERDIRRLAQGVEDVSNLTDELARKLADPDESADGLAAVNNRIVKAQEKVARMSADEIEDLRQAQAGVAEDIEEGVEHARSAAALAHASHAARQDKLFDDLQTHIVEDLIDSAGHIEEIGSAAWLDDLAPDDANALRGILSEVAEAEAQFAAAVREVPEHVMRSEFGLLGVEGLEQLEQQKADAVAEALGKLWDAAPATARDDLTNLLTSMRSKALVRAAKRRRTGEILRTIKWEAEDEAWDRVENLQRVFGAESPITNWTDTSLEMSQWFVANQNNLLRVTRNLTDIWERKAPSLGADDAERVAVYLDSLKAADDARPTASVQGRPALPESADEVLGNLGTPPGKWAEYLEHYQAQLLSEDPAALERMLGPEFRAALKDTSDFVASSASQLRRFQHHLDALETYGDRVANRVNVLLGSSEIKTAADYQAAGVELASLANTGLLHRVEFKDGAVTGQEIEDLAKRAGRRGSFTVNASGDPVGSTLHVTLPSLSHRHIDAETTQKWIEEITPVLSSGAVVIRSVRGADNELILSPSVVLQAAPLARNLPVDARRAQRFADSWRTGVDGSPHTMVYMRSLFPDDPEAFFEGLKTKMSRGKRLTEAERQAVELLQRRTIDFNDDLPPVFVTGAAGSVSSMRVGMAELADDLQSELADIAMGGAVHSAAEMGYHGPQLGRDVRDRIGKGDILRRDEDIDRAYDPTPDPYVTARQAGVESRPSGSQKGSLAKGFGDDGDLSPKQALAKARREHEAQEAGISSLSEEERLAEAVYAPGIHAVDLPPAAQKILKTHLTKARDSKIPAMPAIRPGDFPKTTINPSQGGPWKDEPWDTRVIMQAVADNPEGFTINPRYPAEVPREGFAVSMWGEMVVDADSDLETLGKWLDEIRTDEEKGPRIWLGGWRRDDGTYEISRTVVVRTEADALNFGKKYDQSYYWDVKASKSIPVGYTDPDRVLRKWAEETGLATKLEPFAAEVAENVEARLGTEPFKVIQKALDEGAAMGTIARQRLHSEYMAAWDAEKASFEAQTAAVDALVAARDAESTAIAAERKALFNVLQSSHRITTAKREVRRLKSKTDKERAAVLAEALEGSATVATSESAAKAFERQAGIRYSAQMKEASQAAAEKGLAIKWDGHGRRAGTIGSGTGRPYQSTGAEQPNWGFQIYDGDKRIAGSSGHRTQKLNAQQAMNRVKAFTRAKEGIGLKDPTLGHNTQAAILSDIQAKGTSSRWVWEIIDDDERLMNHLHAVRALREASEAVPAAEAAAEAAQAEFKALAPRFADQFPDLSKTTGVSGAGDRQRLGNLQRRMVAEAMEAEQEAVLNLSKIDETLADYSAQREAAETIDRLRPRALKGSLNDHDLQLLEDAFVVFNHTKWKRADLLMPEASGAKGTKKLDKELRKRLAEAGDTPTTDTIPSKRTKVGLRIPNDSTFTGRYAALTPDEKAMLEAHFSKRVDDSLEWNKRTDKAGTRAVLGTDAAGSSLGISPERLALASEETQEKITELARKALASKERDRNRQFAITEVADYASQAHKLIEEDFISRGLLDEARKMAQATDAIVETLVEDMSDWALVRQYRQRMARSATLQAYSKADALADDQAARTLATDATHTLNRAYAKLKGEAQPRGLLGRVVAAKDPDGELFQAWQSLDSEQKVRQSSYILRALTEQRDLGERVREAQHYITHADEYVGGAEKSQQLYQQLSDGLDDLQDLQDATDAQLRVVRSLGPTTDGDTAAANLVMGRLADQDWAWTRVQEAIRHHPVNVAMAADDAAEAMAPMREGLKVAEQTAELQQSLINDYTFQLRTLGETGFIAPEQMVSAIETLAEGWNPGRAAQWLDQVTSAWRGLAIFSPGFLLRNAQGAVWNNYMAGVSPSSMGRVTKGYFQYAAGGAAEVADTEVRAFIELSVRRGSLFSQGQVGMDVQSVALKDQTWNPVKPFGDKTTQWLPVSKVSDWSAKIEDVVRGSLAFDVMRKGRGSLDARYAEAMAQVQVWHFDYTDLSRYDHNMRLAFPFWTWMSRNFALQLRLMTAYPQQALLADRIMENIGAGSPFNPYIPEWMNMSRYVQAGQSTMVNIELPPTAAYRDAWLGNWAGGEHPAPILGATNPMPRAVLEFAFQQDLFRGYNLEGSANYVRLMENVLPLYDRIHRLGVLPVTGDEAARQKWLWSLAGFVGAPVRGIVDKDAQQVQSFEFPYRQAKLVKAKASAAELRLAEAEALLKSTRSEDSQEQVRNLFLQIARQGR